MKRFLHSFLLVAFLFFSAIVCRAQYTPSNAHSHNDYEQAAPFSAAYEHHFGSMEADIWLVNGDLYVAHNHDEINLERSLDKLYIQPVVAKFRENGGKAWSDHEGSFLLLIDVKDDYQPTLAVLIQKLKVYPKVFDPAKNPNAVRIVITGNRPSPKDFDQYPAFLFFDGDLSKKYNKTQLNRVSLFSDNFRNHSSWNGKGEMDTDEFERLKQTVDSVHKLGNKVRFWNAPDFPNAWKTLMELNVDFINTDHISDLTEYFRKTK